MAEFRPVDIKRYLHDPRKPLDRIDRITLVSNSVNSVKPVSGESSEKNNQGIEASEKKKGIEIAGRGNSLPGLPFALERLVSAASSNLLAGFTFDGVPDINRYVMAWACCYLVGDRDEALNRLRQVQIAREASS